MADKNIKGIKYSLDAKKQTAIVIARKKGYEGDIVIPETVVYQNVTYCVKGIAGVLLRAVAP